MKRKLITSIILFVGFITQSFGQWIVNDPTLTQLSNITWAKELKQAAEQFVVLDKSRDLLSSSLDLYIKVSETIRNSKTVLNVLAKQGEMLKLSGEECTRTDIYATDAYGAYTKQLNSIIEQSMISYELLNTILTPTIKMNDGERISIILELDKRLTESLAQLYDERRRFNQINVAIKRIQAIRN